jgi:hypothetical protein
MLIQQRLEGVCLNIFQIEPRKDEKNSLTLILGSFMLIRIEITQKKFYFKE